MKNTATQITKESHNGFLNLQPRSVAPEKVVSMLEDYASEGRIIDRKAIHAMQGKEFDASQFERMLLAACKGYKALKGHGRLQDADEYSNIFAYLYPLSIK